MNIVTDFTIFNFFLMLDDQRPDTHTDKNEKWRIRIGSEQKYITDTVLCTHVCHRTTNVTIC